MQALPLILSALVALVVTPVLIRGLTEAGFVRRNFAGRELPVPIGLAIPLAAFGALAIVAPLDRLADDQTLGGAGLAAAVAYVLGVCLLGTIDDLVGTPAIGGNLGRNDPRGWRGHAKAVLRGSFSTGFIKAVGALGLAAFAVGLLQTNDFEYLLGIALVILTTNFFNLLDLRPGRSLKVFFVAAGILLVATAELQPLWTLGIFIGPLLVLAFYDLRERGMLGDAGSNAIGAVLGVWMVLALTAEAQAAVLGVVISFTLLGEFKSISQLIDRTPLLRYLDSLGRPRNA